ncbi:MAG: hypothetical protein Q4G49_17745 [Paracoccus sp. (in: a-proteobacteria)]|nr:hypothetical protein [Paracoccus sp. (in: a-proteobacteria)]
MRATSAIVAVFRQRPTGPGQPDRAFHHLSDMGADASVASAFDRSRARPKYGVSEGEFCMNQRNGIGLSGAGRSGLTARVDVAGAVSQSLAAAASAQRIPANSNDPRHFAIRCG